MARAEAPRCFLHGTLIPMQNENAPRKLDDNVRLQFDTKDRADCEAKISSYCKYNVVEQNYRPSKLEGYYKDDKGKKTFYHLSPSCKILHDEETED